MPISKKQPVSGVASISDVMAGGGGDDPPSRFVQYLKNLWSGPESVEIGGETIPLTGTDPGFIQNLEMGPLIAGGKLLKAMSIFGKPGGGGLSSFGSAFRNFARNPDGTLNVSVVDKFFDNILPRFNARRQRAYDAYDFVDNPGGRAYYDTIREMIMEPAPRLYGGGQNVPTSYYGIDDLLSSNEGRVVFDLGLQQLRAGTPGRIWEMARNLENTIGFFDEATGMPTAFWRPTYDDIYETTTLARGPDKIKQLGEYVNMDDFFSRILRQTDAAVRQTISGGLWR